MSVILSENMILNKTRSHDLQNVRKLNCWNFQLVDVSILRTMPNIQFLLLSMNKIKTLADFSYCISLEELYLRQNEIKDLNEIFYLKKLPKLKKLWIAQNPCANVSNYRYTVLKALPQLEVLDNQDVDKEELKKAKELGSDIYDPENVNQLENDSYLSQQNENEIFSEFITSEDSSLHNYCNNSTTSKKDEQLISKINLNEPVSKSNISSNTYDRNSVSEINGNYCNNNTTLNNSLNCTLYSNKFKNSISTFNDDTYGNYSNEFKYNKSIIQSNCSSSASCISNHNVSKQSKTMLSKGGKNRNSNLLSAILCLLKELDFASLEVVETAVHCRMEELDE